MPEVKNAFIKSKMNKDLDARLLPSGEYRDAMNIAISKSEGPDVGAVENIKGNNLLFDIGNVEGVTDLDIIGFFADESNNRIYIFSTDSNVTTSPYNKVANTANCFIHVCQLNSSSTNELTKLVQGSFLNFTKNSFITGVNLLEDLLFFTDNRNQPRVINVNTAINNGVGHYTTEDNISVAKLAPYLPINILDKNIENVDANTTDSTTFVLSGTPTYTPTPGDFVSQGTDEKKIVVSYNSSTKTVTLDAATDMTAGEVVFKKSTMKNRTAEYLNASSGSTGDINNPNYNEDWSGDTDFIQDKFVRFSYRYKFEDNEYSILAPFTAPIFIPKQFGYFVGGAAPNDEELAYKSSIVAFMENFVQEADLKIPFPSKNPDIDYKIKEVDIIYKESNKISIQVLTTLIIDQIADTQYVGNENYFTYTYQSKKPYRTLPDDVVVRVFDKVPVKAQAQEVISNRVVYANYQDKNDAPSSLNYRITGQEKDYARYDLAAQYPYHTLKQNRTYQVGIVLSDKYGRSTSVILSSKDINSDTLGRGSSYFHPYTNSSSNLPVSHPYGDALRILFSQPGIPENNPGGSNYPGTYADGSGKNFTLDSTVNISSTTYTINQDLTSKLSVGDYLKGKNIDYTKITSISFSSPTTTIVTENQIADYYGDGTSTDVVFGYILNALGWYSYKIVVKQTEQDYYNAYLPLVVNGSFNAVTGTGGNPNQDQQAEAVLINDNINKIPRDLSEVGPDQKNFRSSVRLFGRVSPSSLSNSTSNIQWYPANTADQVTLIGTTEDVGITVIDDVYLSESKPLIAVISSNIGKEDPTGAASTVTFGRVPPTADPALGQNLSIYETEPVVSLLDIFYETTTSGLVSELNKEIANATEGNAASSVVDFTIESGYNESMSGTTDVVIDFKFVDAAGTELDEVDIPNPPSVTSVTNADGTSITPIPFQVITGTATGTFTLQCTSGNFVYVDGSETALDFDITMQVTTINDEGAVSSFVTVNAPVANATPDSFSTSYTLTEVEIDEGGVDDGPFLSLTDNTTIPSPAPSQLVDNGSNLATLSGLVFSLSNQERVAPGETIDVDYFNINSDGEIHRNSNVTFAADEDYDMDIIVKDAGGQNINTEELIIPLSIQFVNESLNWLTDGNPETTTDGVGCANSTQSTKNQIRNFVFGSLTNATSSLPSFGSSFGSAQTSQEEISGLTSGTVKFQLHTSTVQESGICVSLEFEVYIQYRANSSSAWTTATKSNGTTFSSPDQVAFDMPTTGQSTTVDIAEFNIAGEYRVIVVPDQSDGLCSDDDCDSDTPIVFLRYIDPFAS